MAVGFKGCFVGLFGSNTTSPSKYKDERNNVAGAKLQAWEPGAGTIGFIQLTTQRQRLALEVAARAVHNFWSGVRGTLYKTQDGTRETY